MDNEETKDELEVNQKNAEAFNTLMQESSTDVDKFYYDKNNSIVRILLIILGIIIILGCLIVFIHWLDFI